MTSERPEPPAPPAPHEPARAPTDLARLVDLVTRLRAPDGCPWDREQTLADLRAYLLEEAHETAAALDSRRPGRSRLRARRSPLPGRLPRPPGRGVRRLPPLRRDRPRGGQDDRPPPPRLRRRRKARRRPRRPRRLGAPEAEAGGRRAASPSSTAPPPPHSPALVAAYRLTQKAAGVGFDWPNAEAVLAKLDEELAELRIELESHATSPTEATKIRLHAELGDLLFAVANLARHLDLDPEAALAQTNLKFRRRFAQIETELAARGRKLEEATLEEMDAIWIEAKRGESP